MNSLLRQVAPSATDMIRLDHTHTTSLFHHYKRDSSPSQIQGIVEQICLALEIHAQLEEEIFYPAAAAAAQEGPLTEKLTDEQHHMRTHIAALRAGTPGSPEYEEQLMKLMREVFHHVAEEETVLIPAAELALGNDRLKELGAQMTKRRMELTAPKAGTLVTSMAKSAPATFAVLVAGTLIGASYFAKRAWAR